MVAISLYRGNLHRVPDVPRRWVMPCQNISLKDFKLLLNRRSKALSRTAPATSSNPNPNGEDRANNDITDADKNEASPVDPGLKKGDVENSGEGCSVSKVDASVMVAEAVEDEGGSNGGDCGDGGVGLIEKPVDVYVVTEEKTGAPDSGGGDVVDKLVDVVNLSVDAKASAPDSAGAGCDNGSRDAEGIPAEKQEVPAVNIDSEPIEKVDVVPSEKEKRKREVEEKLRVLNEKKHNLVQALKQILNAEEELKRRTAMQGMANRPPGPLHVDVTNVTNDSGSMTRHNTPRLGLDANPGGDVEGGEVDDASNHNLSSRPLLRMSSTSPSESPLRRPALSPHNLVLLPSRASLVAAGSPSPSRFAPPGHQGHPANLPSVSLSGTNYIASSPSPAASGGTSVFKDTRQASPWN